MSEPTSDDRATDTPRPPRVVVGVDGSPGSRAALVYAWAAAARRGADLEVVATWSVQTVWVGGYPLGVPSISAVREEMESRVQAMVDEVRGDPAVAAVPGAADVRVTTAVSVGPAAQELVDASADADLVVVGNRGRGAVRSVVLGSVALHCVTHARCPVVVVHPSSTGHARRRPVIVGIDGSAASRAALLAGVAEAARLGTDVVAVTTYQMADHWMALSTVVVPTAEEVRWDLQRGGEAMLEDVLEEHRTGSGGRSPDARVVVAEGAPADILGQWAAGAALLVVGSRGHGALRGLLLGSVALACAMHASGAVMVVHPLPDRAPTGTTQRATVNA
ncbi:universal stress protein [Modestobacter marinus]|uniref:Nucleotide-binding universal stress UspA family protein n=1 Tax=Modestobacter marinus TaxID=477641 RepID=A0A846LRT9_9ACTN|nr:universal stress protein [Modestobacter marinus]NIH69164.1 nucleotide-binding universal stress UspA family protein [Modestobacter marinus]GGL77062.1 universal stress protein UspA [Modestobacter marinus]